MHSSRPFTLGCCTRHHTALRNPAGVGHNVQTARQHTAHRRHRSVRVAASSAGSGPVVSDRVVQVSPQLLEEAGYGEAKQLLAPLAGKSPKELEGCLPQVLPRLAALLADGIMGILYLPAAPGVDTYAKVAASCGLQVLERSDTQQALLYHPSQPGHSISRAVNGYGLLYRQAAILQDQPGLITRRLLVTGDTAWSTTVHPFDPAAGNTKRRDRKQQQVADVAGDTAASKKEAAAVGSSSSSTMRFPDQVVVVSPQQLEEAGYEEVQQLLLPLMGKSIPELEGFLPQVLPRLAPLLADGTMDALLLPAPKGRGRAEIYAQAAASCGLQVVDRSRGRQAVLYQPLLPGGRLRKIVENEYAPLLRTATRCRSLPMLCQRGLLVTGVVALTNAMRPLRTATQNRARWQQEQRKRHGGGDDEDATSSSRHLVSDEVVQDRPQQLEQGTMQQELVQLMEQLGQRLCKTRGAVLSCTVWRMTRPPADASSSSSSAIADDRPYVVGVDMEEKQQLAGTYLTWFRYSIKIAFRGAEAQLWLSTTEWTTTTQVQRKVEEYLKAIQH